MAIILLVLTTLLFAAIIQKNENLTKQEALKEAMLQMTIVSFGLTIPFILFDLGVKIIFNGSYLKGLLLFMLAVFVLRGTIYFNKKRD